MIPQHLAQMDMFLGLPVEEERREEGLKGGVEGRGRSRREREKGKGKGRGEKREREKKRRRIAGQNKSQYPNNTSLQAQHGSS